MGAWGYDLFEDDQALDVRDEYRELLQQGVPDDEAWRTVIDNNDAEDPDHGPTVWLALASTQWKLGRLDPFVKERALQVIQDGEGLELWREAGDEELAARVRVLKRVGRQLLQPQPERRAFPQKWRYVTDLEPGDVIGRFDKHSRYWIYLVIRLEEERGGVDPVLQGVWWLNDVPPRTDQLARLRMIPFLRVRATRHNKPDKDWAACGFELLGAVPVPPRLARKRAMSTMLWANLD